MALAFVEPVAVPELHIDGIASIDQVGSNLKLAFYTLQRNPDGTQSGVIVARFAMGAERVHSSAVKAMAVAETLVELPPHH